MRPPEHLTDAERAAWYQADPTRPNVHAPFTSFRHSQEDEWRNSLLWTSDADCYPFDKDFPSALLSFNVGEEIGTMRTTKGDFTDFIFTYEGRANLNTPTGAFTLKAGMYAAVSSDYVISGQAKGIVVRRYGYSAPFMVGGPIEPIGRLKYIDGCTDSLLIPPTKKGDACFNHLHFPPNIDQTMHTHPSVRIGLVVRGSGTCVTPQKDIALFPGQTFVIHTEGLHKFKTTSGSDMDVIAFHPDSDFGPTDEEHPMLNRTAVDGVSAKFIDSIRTK